MAHVPLGSHTACTFITCLLITPEWPLNKAHIFQQQNISWEPLHCHPTHAWLGFIPQVCHWTLWYEEGWKSKGWRQTRDYQFERGRANPASGFSCPVQRNGIRKITSSHVKKFTEEWTVKPKGNRSFANTVPIDGKWVKCHCRQLSFAPF